MKKFRELTKDENKEYLKKKLRSYSKERYKDLKKDTKKYEAHLKRCREYQRERKEKISRQCILGTYDGQEINEFLYKTGLYDKNRNGAYNVYQPKKKFDGMDKKSLVDLGLVKILKELVSEYNEPPQCMKTKHLKRAIEEKTGIKIIKSQHYLWYLFNLWYLFKRIGLEYEGQKRWIFDMDKVEKFYKGILTKNQ